MDFILRDFVVGLGWIAMKSLLLRTYAHLGRVVHQRFDKTTSTSVAVEQTLLLGSFENNGDGHHDTNAPILSSAEVEWPSTSLISTALILWTASTLIIIYFASLLLPFYDVIPASAAAFAIVMMPIAGFILIRSLGETDNGAGLAIGRPLRSFSKTG